MKALIVICIWVPIFILGGCLFEAVSPIIPKGNGSEDPPITLPACDTFTMITKPNFATLYTEFFNGVPTDTTWYLTKPSGSNVAFSSLGGLLDSVLPDSVDVQIFQNGNAIAAILIDTSVLQNKLPLSLTNSLKNKIWTRDAIGQKALLTLNLQAFIFGGALTFEEYKKIAERLPSVRIFNFRNTNWTQAQYEEVALIILGECKLGRDDANFMFNAFPISDSLYCQFNLVDWEVRGQVLNCN